MIFSNPKAKEEIVCGSRKERSLHMKTIDLKTALNECIKYYEDRGNSPELARLIMETLPEEEIRRTYRMIINEQEGKKEDDLL